MKIKTFLVCLFILPAQLFAQEECALWISTKRNYKNEILELKSWGNVCDSLSNHIFWNLYSKNDFPNSLHYEYFKLEIMSYLTKHPAPKWWLAALVNYKDNQWCYENPKM